MRPERRSPAEVTTPQQGPSVSSDTDRVTVAGGRTGSPLRMALGKAMAEQGCPMKDLTVLAPQNDPFRLDTPARHRDGEWLAITAADLGLGDRKIHLRGLHYMVLGRPKPDGSAYANTDDDWLWLSGDAAKAARFLGYLPWDQIEDHRNAPPEIREFEPPEPGAYLSTELNIQIPYDITPTLYTDDFRGAQPYKLVLFGEKSSLADVLSPVAEDYEADLYLPTGEISDTLLYRMASVAAADGRPMAVLCFSDAAFFDHTLAARVAEYRSGWLDRARELIAATFDLDRLDEIRREAETRLSEMRRQIRELNNALRIEVDEDDLPLIEIPAAELNGHRPPPPLLDSRWDFAEQCRALITSKQYVR